MRRALVLVATLAGIGGGFAPALPEGKIECGVCDDKPVARRTGRLFASYKGDGVRPNPRRFRKFKGWQRNHRNR